MRVNRVGVGWLEVDLRVYATEVPAALNACRKREVMLIRKDLPLPSSDGPPRSARFF